MECSHLPIAIIGAGPVGLAAAAHALERGLPVVILEASDRVAASQRDWGHVQLFSPWAYNIDAAARRLLNAHSWSAPAEDGYPTGAELYSEYLQPLANTPEISKCLRLGHRVTHLAKQSLGKVKHAGRAEAAFVVRCATAQGAAVEIEARAVLDASGTWFQPNPLGASGIPAIGEQLFASQIDYGMPDIAGQARDKFAGKRVLVVGAGHSAAQSILALCQLAREAPATEIVWATRGSNLARVFGGGSRDGLPERGRLGAELQQLLADGRLQSIENFHIHRIEARAGGLSLQGDRSGSSFSVEKIDRVIAATGQRPELAPLRELRVQVDSALECVPALAPLIDPNEHSCGSVRPHGEAELRQPEDNFYIVGAKSYGRAPTFLLATGYEQVRSVIAAIAGDVEAAQRVELNLPETGVCSSQRETKSKPGPSQGASNCCPPKGGCC